MMTFIFAFCMGAGITYGFMRFKDAISIFRKKTEDKIDKALRQ